MGIFGVAVVAFDQGEEPVVGFVLAGEGYGREQGGAEPGVAGAGERFFEGGEGFGGAGFGDGDGGFGGGVVLVKEESGGPWDGAGAFEVEDSAVTGSEEFGFVAG